MGYNFCRRALQVRRRPCKKVNTFDDDKNENKLFFYKNSYTRKNKIINKNNFTEKDLNLKSITYPEKNTVNNKSEIHFNKNIENNFELSSQNFEKKPDNPLFLI